MLCGLERRVGAPHTASLGRGGGCRAAGWESADTPANHHASNGAVSTLSGPAFDTVEPLITGLPVSNHDHGVNAIQFDDNGDLYVAVGGNTNAGVEHCNIGGLPESPLSAAILKADVSTFGFNGNITYVETDTGTPNNDQVFGDIVDVAPGVDVSPFGLGLRNPFGMVYTTWGDLYATDNGPNIGFGAASTGPNTCASLPKIAFRTGLG